MNKSKLKTDFICIATSGYTVDGRQITAQELHEMAETYDPEHYTANLWPEHRRYFSCGEVLEVKAEEQENGEVKLFAKIAPNQQLIDFNRDGQKLFTSVEIAGNFRNSGKAYLSGLGVTDSPASVGTTKLDFFNHQDKVQCSEFINIDFTEQKNDEEKMTRSFFNAIKQFFSSSEQQEEQSTPHNNNNKEDDAMNDKQFEQLIEAVNGLGAKIDNHFSAKVETKEPKNKPEEKKDEQPQSVTAEQFNQLLTTVQALDKKFNELSQEQTTVPSGVPTVESENVYSLNGYNIDLSKGF
ncbi:phage capsid protein [Haemophilus influenzae biotype aegyptius]|uniref:GPO family capsid scaffolding protein n=1 Tax=Haemophilus influenzae TaxID=727 RepID=UPI0001F36CB5|nr:GPO family capsid scaffolding protein [Haemophilus influenzae]QEQ61691.1 phage capsid protein [Haemophilus influenzae biotype aegyptius]QEQ64501.1 phage capsid protein [Haemophilus influenzae biotype aegyptius]QEQ65487.1 phage capsid protein [Haemophilus influenzae biotype aegyptius]TMQ37267.1 phage capsid protein [Haemophilus influenzae biotype aegyptius]TMQ38252.1 phage capsid protein [Haemophilus influenzae biotype aegyptius]